MKVLNPSQHECQTKCQTLLAQLGNVQTCSLLGKGEYGQCYGVVIDKAPHRVVVKMHRYQGMGLQEYRQLQVLREYAPVPVPQVYACLPETDRGEFVVMDWLPGTGCPKPETFPYAQRKMLQQQVVDLLLKLHAVNHPQGYGSFGGPFYQRWWDYYGQRVQQTYQTIYKSESACAYFGAQGLALMELALSHGERIVSTATSRPVLLHGDFCFGNLLFDPQTSQISGLIDPLDAEWGDRELDLVSIINGHIHHFELLNRYREAVQLNEYFPLRYWFYQIWKWLFYYTRVQVNCRSWVLRCGRELTKAIDKYL